MSVFAAFVETYGHAIEHQRADAKMLAAYKGIVPDLLLEFWERFGFGGYAQGLLWVVNPTKLEDVLAEWVPATGKKKRAVPVVRTAFGNVVYWQDEAFTLQDVHYAKRFPAGKNVELFFDDYLVDSGPRKNVLQEPAFKKALKMLGVLKDDEMYAFKLALSMGGDPGVKNMYKAKIREQLSILAHSS